ncbi:MAG: sporulation protein YabP [Clostridia bacterium]|nr:sporulation protein YabP [Clostridia bacterium]MBQ7090383.1 sporulation protein YabP [Clostridia bacterium]
MEEERKTGNHQLTLEGRRLLRASGVLDVDSFDEKTVVILTEQGVLTVEGEDLHINHLNVENGDITIEGEVDAMQYADLKEKGGGLFKGLFR